MVEVSLDGGSKKIEEGYEVGQYAEVGIDHRLIGVGTGPHLSKWELAECAVFCWWHYNYIS
jgi:hypothetical protein